MVEWIMYPCITGNLPRLSGRDALADDVVGVSDELEQAGPDDVGVLNERELHFEAVRHGHVVGIHPGDDVEPAGGQTVIQGWANARVAIKSTKVTDAASGNPPGTGELLTDRPSRTMTT
jgi:hypothetical protein